MPHNTQGVINKYVENASQYTGCYKWVCLEEIRQEKDLFLLQRFQSVFEGACPASYFQGVAMFLPPEVKNPAW